MTSSISTRSTFSGLSEGCLSEAGSSRLRKGASMEESQEDCPKCAAMRLNTVIAEEALASLSGQFKNLQKELKKTEQVSKINEEQAKYIDERRSKLEKLEAEHTSLYAEYENLRINHESLKRQYDEVVATARRNQRLIEESVKYHETCKVAMENLMAEKEARQELLAKYLKSVEAAAKINDSMKQLEKKCVQLQATNEKLEPFKYHCPAMLRLLLEFGEIIENNGLMTKSLQKRFARYKDKDDLCEYLLRKTKRITNLSESSAMTAEESSDDDELAKGVEDLLLTTGSPLRLRSPKKRVPFKEEIRSAEKSSAHLTKTDIRVTEKGDILTKKWESLEASHVSLPKIQCSSDVNMKKTKMSCKLQLELNERQEKEILYKREEKVMFADVTNPCIPSTSCSSLTKENKLTENHAEQAGHGSEENIEDVCENMSNPAVEKDKKTAWEMEANTNSAIRSSKEKQVYGSTERLSTWLSFVHLDPLLPELSRPAFLGSGTFEQSKQHGSDDYMDNLFGPLSPSISSRRTSVSSTEGCVVPKNMTKSKSGMKGAEETSFVANPLLPPSVQTPTYSSATDSFVTSAYGTASDIGNIAGIHHEQTDSEFVQNLKVSARDGEILSLEEVLEEKQTSTPTVTTDSKCVRTLSSRRKRIASYSQNEDGSLGVRVGCRKLAKVISTKSTDTKNELEGNQCSKAQRPAVENVSSRRTASNSKRCLGKEESLVRLPESKVGNILEMVKMKSDELKTIKRTEQKSEVCIGNPKRPLRPSPRRKQVRIDSSSSEDNQKLIIDAEELVLQENANTKLDEAVKSRILADDSTTVHELLQRKTQDFAIPLERLDEWKISKDNSEKHEIPSCTKLVNQDVKLKQNSQSSAILAEGKITVRNRLENGESLFKNVRIMESKKCALLLNNKQKANKAIEHKLAEGVSSTKDKWEGVDRTPTSSQKSKVVGIRHGKQLMSENSEGVNSSMTSGVRSVEIEFSDLDDGYKRLEIVTDDVKTPSLNMENASDVTHTSNNWLDKVEATAGVIKKSVNTVRSEMYKKIHKRLSTQTSCMKKLGRVQGRKSAKKEMTCTLPTSAKTERPNSAQRKRTSIMLRTGRSELKQAKDIGVPAHDTRRVGTSATKVPVGSDEAAVLCLFDQALSESNYNDKLIEIIQKFQTPAISRISCEKLADCCVKFINKLDVGNMWHSVVLAVRYWMEKQRGRCTVSKVLELHQVASSKERNFIEVLHQLSGEEHWSDIISFFLRKMAMSLMKTRLISVAQHGLSVRCVLLCTRILLQSGSSNGVMEQVTNLLRRLIERDPSDKVVPMMCYSVAIVPEIVDRLLIDENEQFEPVRRVMSVHLASRDEFFTIFNKVIMSRLLNRSSYSDTCMQKLNIDGFHRWLTESISMIITDRDGLNLDSMELSPKLSSTMMTCYALFSLATNRLVCDKEALVFPVLNECVHIISNHFKNLEKKGNEMFADIAELRLLSDDVLVKTVLRLLLFGRLMTSFIRNTECCMLTQIANLVEEIYRLREFARLKLKQADGTVENRLLYFGLNDWLRIVKPWTDYLRSAFTVV